MACGARTVLKTFPCSDAAGCQLRERAGSVMHTASCHSRPCLTPRHTCVGPHSIALLEAFHCIRLQHTSVMQDRAPTRSWRLPLGGTAPTHTPTRFLSLSLSQTHPHVFLFLSQTPTRWRIALAPGSRGRLAASPLFRTHDRLTIAGFLSRAQTHPHTHSHTAHATASAERKHDATRACE